MTGLSGDTDITTIGSRCDPQVVPRRQESNVPERAACGRRVSQVRNREITTSEARLWHPNLGEKIQEAVR